jgi:hypothetical protein
VLFSCSFPVACARSFDILWAQNTRASRSIMRKATLSASTLVRHVTFLLRYSRWLFALAGVSYAADFNPVPLRPGGFTQDIVVEKTAPKPKVPGA